MVGASASYYVREHRGGRAAAAVEGFRLGITKGGRWPALCSIENEIALAVGLFTALFIEEYYGYFSHRAVCGSGAGEDTPVAARRSGQTLALLSSYLATEDCRIRIPRVH